MPELPGWDRVTAFYILRHKIHYPPTRKQVVWRTGAMFVAPQKETLYSLIDLSKERLGRKPSVLKCCILRRDDCEVIEILGPPVKFAGEVGYRLRT